MICKSLSYEFDWEINFLHQKFGQQGNFAETAMFTGNKIHGM